ncbi:MAG: MFS transporter [Paracoccaceae bacterium]|mgnify:FL=1
MTDVRAPGTNAAPVFREGFCAPAARPFILASAILASALGFIDGTVVSIALPAIRASLGADLLQAQWIHNAYMLTISALILIGGAIGDRLGLARVFAAGIGLFVGASLLCAIASSPLFLILARAFQGVGAAIMVPGSLAIIARAYPREERGRAIGIWAAASAITTALGPIIGGLALSLGGPEMWRWIFAINLPLGALAIWLLLSRVGLDPSNSDRQLDVPGAVLATLGLLALAWGLTQLEHGEGATLWIATGAVILLVFLWVEARAPQPMMPLSLFASRTFSGANTLAFTLYSALGIMFFFMPMTFIAGWGVTEIEASAAFAPLSVFLSLLSSRAGALADRIGPKPLLIVGPIIVGVGYGLIGLLAPQQNFWGHMVPAMCLVGLGMSAVVAPLSTSVMGAVEDAQSGIASGINNAVTRMAGLISVAAVGGIVATVYAASGGTESFGLESDAPGHAAAMTTAFQTLAYIAGSLCWLSAVVAAMFIDVPQKAQIDST